ncbi:MAG: DUF3788 family protein [Verrucomicrobia bacterium]|nr:DUF3788 family protein [Verrucomicrobiota bacterium]
MQRNERFLDKASPPTQEAVEAALGARALKTWRAVVAYLDDAYGVEPDLGFTGGTYGWRFRYRKGGRTIGALYPEKGSFTVLVVLNAEELEELEPQLGRLSEPLQKVIEGATPYNEGKWCWMRMPGTATLGELKRLFALKRKPKA